MTRLNRFTCRDSLPCGHPVKEGCSKRNADRQQGTYLVEAVNADLRHYLKRFARKAGCLSRRMLTLISNLRMFVDCCNHPNIMKSL